jgi:hypothetical protein
MAKDKEEGEDSVFRPGGARRLLNGSEEDLTDDERALLLALIGVDTETGKSLEEKDHAALDKLKAQVKGYDAEELAQAVKHIVTAEPRESRKLEWPELKRGRGRRSSKRSSAE